MRRFPRMLPGLIAAAVMIPAIAQELASGLDIGKPVLPFDPRHVVGPLKGTTACPP